MALTLIKNNNLSKQASDFINYQENQKQFRAKVKQFENALKQVCIETKQEDNLPALQGYEEGFVKHDFADGQYIRTITMPKGLVVSPKIHNQNHPFFVMKGECSVYSETGMQKIRAPFHGITKAGTKRLLYVYEECVWITVHCTDKLTLEEVEEECIAKDFEEVGFMGVDTKQIDKLIDQVRNR